VEPAQGAHGVDQGVNEEKGKEKEKESDVEKENKNLKVEENVENENKNHKCEQLVEDGSDEKNEKRKELRDLGAIDASYYRLQDWTMSCGADLPKGLVWSARGPVKGSAMESGRGSEGFR
jgi:hypothetical protein